MLGAGSITFQNDDSDEDDEDETSDEYMDGKALDDETKPVNVTDKLVSDERAGVIRG